MIIYILKQDIDGSGLRFLAAYRYVPEKSELESQTFQCLSSDEYVTLSAGNAITKAENIYIELSMYNLK